MKGDLFCIWAESETFKVSMY